MPELEHLTLSELLVRVVGAHERRTSSKVGLTLDDMPCDPSLPTKITTYRLVQEALSNAYRHGGAVGQKVEARCRDGGLELEVSDQGPGFQWTGRSADGDHLGLVGMRERVESQGGSFRVETRPGRGTRVIAFLPMQSNEEEQAIPSEEV